MFFKKGFQSMRKEKVFENYRDIDIPKKIKVTIVENLEVNITYPSPRLASFLAKGP